MELDEVYRGMLADAGETPGIRIIALIRPYFGVLTERTLRTRVDRLEEAGLIRVERRFRKCTVFVTPEGAVLDEE